MFHRKNMGRLALVTLGALAMAGTAFAGTPADPEFAGLATRLTNWVTGNLAVSITWRFC